jgi:hypothetical protein
MYPKEFFKNTRLQPKHSHCFVLMPFAEEFREVFDAISEAVEDPSISYTCSRADDVFGGGHIIEDILLGIGQSEVVIADLTTRNPNVFYELGVTHMIKDIRKVIIITQTMNDVPFDLRQFRCLVYSQDERGLRQLRRSLIKAIQEISDGAYRFNVKSGGTYKFDTKLFGIGEDRSVYDFEIPEIWTFRDGAKMRLKVNKYSIGNEPATVHDDGHGIKIDEHLPMPYLPWELVLERADEKTAQFCLISNEESKKKDKGKELEELERMAKHVTNYFVGKTITMVSFETLREKINSKYSDELLLEMIDKFPDRFRRAPLKGDRAGLKKL